MTSSQHAKASAWIRYGIFDDLKSFAGFEARANQLAEEKDRGDVCEICIEACH